MFQTLDISMQPFHIFTTAEETIDAIKAICKEKQADAWLFGSQSRNSARSSSDIDIAIKSPEFDFICEEIENIDTVYNIDVIDLDESHAKEIEDGWIRIA